RYTSDHGNYMLGDTRQRPAGEADNRAQGFTDRREAGMKGSPVSVGTLIGYFTERTEARKALRELQRRGFRRAALVHKTADGAAHITEPFVWHRAVGVSATAILFGGLAGVASLMLPASASILGGSLATLI